MGNGVIEIPRGRHTSPVAPGATGTESPVGPSRNQKRELAFIHSVKELRMPLNILLVGAGFTPAR
jgi:hypothetical protein